MKLKQQAAESCPDDTVKVKAWDRFDISTDMLEKKKTKTE